MPVTQKGGKGRIRALNRRGTATGKLRAGEAAAGRPSEPRACERCGAVLHRRVWRSSGTLSRALLDRVTWGVCPACRQVEGGAGQGRIVLEGSILTTHGDDLRARIANVATRAFRTQPERRTVAFTEGDGSLEVITTSQKLAHRIVRELMKAFGGRATYAWSDDGTLFARWRCDPVVRTTRRTAGQRASG